MKLGLFLTKRGSLQQWHEDGSFSREIAPYKELTNRLNLNITIFTYGEQNRELEILKDNGMSSLDVHSVPKNIWNYLTFIRRIQGHDVLKSNQIKGALLPCILGLITRKSVIVRGGYELYQFSRHLSNNKFKKILVWFYCFLCYQLSSVIQISTENDAKFIVSNFFIRKEKVRIRPNWIRINLFNNNIITQKRDGCLFVGRLEYQKDIPLLCSFARNYDGKMLIVGNGSQNQEIKNLQYLKKKINWLKICENRKMPHIYNEHKYYIITSLFEGHPKTLLEAMACGCICICVDAPGVSSVISHGENGFIVDRDSSSILKVIKLIEKDEALQVKVSKQAAEFILNNFSFENHLNEERLLLQEIGGKV